MKASSKSYRIVTSDRGSTWRVERKSDGAVVWSGAGGHKAYLEARSQHAALELGIDIKAARRMGNP